MSEQQVLLVNERDEPIGTMEKMEVHQKGLLHRAFSVFLFNKSGEMLLQQRAAEKYHGALLWSNTCCSHPYPDEDIQKAAERRLAEELGIKAPLEKIFHFTYKATVENSLIEHEFDHVFAGEYEGAVHPNKSEVAAYKFISFEELKGDMNLNPGTYTSWFKLVLPRIEQWWREIYGRKVSSY